MTSERRSNDFSVSGVLATCDGDDNRQFGFPALAVRSVCHLHGLLVPLHSVAVSTYP